MALTPDAAARIQELLAERQTLKTTIEEATKRIDNFLTPQLVLELSVGGIKSTQVAALGKTWSCYINDNPGKQYLDRMKLVEAGVTNEQLKKGTSTAKSSVGVTVKEIGKKKEGNGEEEPPQ
jgi:hypothetical protein